MGSFFSNVQVRTQDSSGRDEVVAAVRAHLAADGRYVQVESADEAQRSVVIGPAVAAGGAWWTPVYDQGAELGTDPLRELAAALSRAVSNYAVSLGVHDSDVLTMQLFGEGDELDTYDSFPEYFSMAMPEAGEEGDERVSYEGDPDKWRLLLVDGSTVEQLAQAFASDDVFAEATLGTIGELFGWDNEHTQTGFRYLEPGEAHTVLHFRLRATASQGAGQQEEQGPPTLTRYSFTPQMELSVGDQTQLSCSFESTGGASQGVEVALWGSAVDAAVFDASEATIRRRVGDEFVDQTVELEARDADHGRVLVARFPDVEIPAGLGDIYGPGGDPTMLRQAMAASFQKHLHLIVPATVREAGEFTLNVGMVPEENREGFSSTSVHLAITPPLRRPRHYAGDNASQYLRMMNTPSHLLALVVLRADRAVVAEQAADAFERWHQVCGFQKYMRMVTPDIGKRAQTGAFAGDAIPDGDPWKTVREQLETAMQVIFQDRSTAPVDPDDMARYTHPGGFALSEPRIWFQGKDDQPMVHVGFSCRLDDVDAGLHEDIEATLRTIVDELMEHAGGVQAFVARWAWSPLLSVDSTPYELACGVHGQCTGGRTWATRYVRAVTEQMWLGPELRGHIDEQRLAEVTCVEELGQALRVEIGPEASVDELETVLAEVLPDADDWRSGVDRLYGR